MPNEPFYYSTRHVAIMEAKRLLEYDLLQSSKHYAI